MKAIIDFDNTVVEILDINYELEEVRYIDAFEEVSKLMGHSSINTTMIYADIDDQKLRNSFNSYIN